MDDDDLTPEEMKMLQAITSARIKALEKKAIARLNMTDEEKQAFKIISKMKKDPELKDMLITMLIMGTNGETESESDKEMKPLCQESP